MKIAQIAFAGFVLAVAVAYEVMALAMPRGSIGYPGPGFFPVMVGAFLLVAAAGCLLQAVLTGGSLGVMPPDSGDAAQPSDRRLHRAVLLLGLLVAYGFTLKPLGFPIAIFLFVLAAIRAFGYRRWLPALLITACLAVVSYVTFVSWLKVPLPMGPVGELLE